MRKLRSRGRPSPALVLAIVALFLALSGGAIAAKKAKIGTKQLKNNAVTTAKLTPGERSQGFITTQNGATTTPAATDTTVATLNLPAGGNYVVTAQASFGPNSAAATLYSCTLKNGGTTLSSADGATPPLPAFSSSIAVTGVSPGGTVTLSCNPDNAGQVRNRVIDAVRVNSVATQ